VKTAEPNPPQGALYTEDETFRFSCHPGVPCFNRCCEDVNIYLTPYDIAEMRRALGLSSGEFLRRHALPLFPRPVGHPVILLRMDGETRRCLFAGPGGCRVYEARPWSCRSFPLEPVEEDGRRRFREIRRPFCRGFETEEEVSIGEWRESQEMQLREAVNSLWATVTHHPDVERVNLLEGAGRDMFFLGSYNPDEFRTLVLGRDFQRSFEVDEQTLDLVREDDIELLGFAFKWLRTVLFGEEALKRRR